MVKLSTKWEILPGFLRKLRRGPPDTPSSSLREEHTLTLRLSPEPSCPSWVGSAPPGRLARAEHGGQGQLLETSQAAAYRTEE